MGIFAGAHQSTKSNESPKAIVLPYQNSAPSVLAACQEVAGRLSGSDTLPAVTWDRTGDHLTLYMATPLRHGCGMFFYEMVSRWLVPDRRLSITDFFVGDCIVSSLGDSPSTLGKLSLFISDKEESEAIFRMLPLLLEELKLGLTSSYHAARILEIKGLSTGKKTALVQEFLRKAIRRFPKVYDYDIIPLMQRFFIHTGEELRKTRSVTALQRAISGLYRIRKKVFASIGSERHVFVQCRRARVSHLFGVKPVLSLNIGITVLRENELCKACHIEKAVQYCIPSARVIPESMYVDYTAHEEGFVCYVEIEKDDEGSFSSAELSYIKCHFPSQLKARIEHLLKPLFIPRNEEEVLKNIILLSGQLKFANDLPQMIISFDEQTDTRLCFTVVLARLLKHGAASIESVVEHADDVALDKVRIRGMLRKRYPKELSVLRIDIPITPHLRDDGRIHFVAARRKAHMRIEELVGEVRDYYGGMYEKQQKLLEKLEQQLLEKHAALPLEQGLVARFYDAIFPVEYKSVMSVEVLARLYSYFVMLRENGRMFCKGEHEKTAIILFKLDDLSLKQTILQQLHAFEPPSARMLIFHYEEWGQVYLGCIYTSPEEKQRNHLVTLLQKSLEK